MNDLDSGQRRDDHPRRFPPDPPQVTPVSSRLGGSTRPPRLPFPASLPRIHEPDTLPTGTPPSPTPEDPDVLGVGGETPTSFVPPEAHSNRRPRKGGAATESVSPSYLSPVTPVPAETRPSPVPCVYLFIYRTQRLQRT